MIEIAVVLGVLFSVACISYAVAHSISLGRVTMLDWALLGAAGVYGCGWIIVMLHTESGGNPTWQNWLLPFTAYYPIYSLCCFVMALSLVFGWSAFGTKVKIGRNQDLMCCRLEKEGQLVAVSWCLLIAAVIGQWLYARAYGGMMGVFQYSILIRSAAFEQVPSNPLSFLHPIGGLSLFASFGFYGQVLSGTSKPRHVLGLVLSVLFSLSILFSWMGRIAIVMYPMTLVLGTVLFGRWRPTTVILAVLTSMVIMVGSTYLLSKALQLKFSDGVFPFLARELSFPPVSFFAQMESGEHVFRGFKDLIASPVFLLPSSIWTDFTESVSHVNTEVILGARKGEHGVTGGIPVDLITLGFMQAWVPGIVVVGFLFGGGLRIIQGFLDRLALPGFRSVLEAYIALKVAVLGLYYSQPDLLVSSNFTLIVAFTITYLVVGRGSDRQIRTGGGLQATSARGTGAIRRADD